MKKWTFTLLFSVFFTLLLTGCIQSVELKDRAIVQAVGIDFKDGIYTVTIQKFRPEGGGGQTGFDASKLNNKVLQTTGLTVTDALNDITLQQGKDVFYGNNNLLIIGRKTCEQGMGSVVNFFNSDNQARPTIHVAMSDTDAADIITTQFSQGITPALAIDLMLASAKKNGTIAEVTLMELIKIFNTEGSNPYLPIIATSHDFSGEPNLIIKGTAIFKGDKLVDEYQGDQSRGLLWVNRKVDETAMVVQAPSVGRCALFIDHNETKIKAKLVDGKPEFTIKIYTQSLIKEVAREDGGGVEIDDLSLLSQLQKDAITHEITLALKKGITDNQVDVFRFGEHIRQKYPKYWKENSANWDKILPTCKIVMDIECNIDRIGLENKYWSKD